MHFLAHREPVPAGEVGSLTSLLEPDERSRAERFQFERDRNAFVLAHALLRRVLSRYERVQPDSWRFTAGPWKAGDRGPHQTHWFNL